MNVLHFATHPIQYFAPLYREIQKCNRFELDVFFGSDFGTVPSFDPGLLKKIEFDVPLLDGYRSRVLPNRGSGIPDGKWGSFDVPDIGAILDINRPDLIWIHGWGYKAQHQLARAARRRGIPYMVRGESTLLDTPAYSVRWWGRRFKHGRFIHSAACCLYIGQHNREFYESMGVNSNKLLPAHYSIDDQFFRDRVASPSERLALRSQYGASNEDFVVVTVAKLVARKRVNDVIEAVAKLPPEFRLWVVGDGVDRESLHQLGEDKLGERISWLGFANQSFLPKIFSAADVFVLASDSEPWGLVSNEAMACGLPAILSNKVGCAINLAKGERGAIQYDCGNINMLSKTISRLRLDQVMFQQMKVDAPLLIEREYSSKATANQICTAVSSLERR